MSRSSFKEQINDFMNKMPTWKKKLWQIFVLGGPILVAGLMIWMFTSHGFTGSFIWFPVIFYVVIIIIVAAIALPLLSILDIKKAAKKGDRKHTPSRIIWTLGIFAVIIPLGFIGLTAINALHPAGAKAPQLYITSQTGSNGIPDMAVSYWSDAPTQDSLKWGEGALTTTITDTGPTTQHTFVLTDLKPNSTYMYQINGAGEIYNFTTMTGSNDYYRFAVTSDPHYGRDASRPDISAKLMAQMIKPANNLSSFYMLGDYVEYGFVDAQWKEALDSTSPYTTQIPFRPIIGNHESLIAGGTPYYLDYCYPEKMPVGTDKGSRLYHQIDVNNIHIFMLDLEWGIEQYQGLEQQTWFEAQIAKIPKSDWTIVMAHCFFYSSGTTSLGMPWYDHPQLIPAFEQIFIDNDVDMVFSGHNHHAEILNKSGVAYFIAGAMGGLPDHTATYSSTSSLWYQHIANEGQFGYFEVDIHGPTATVTFRNHTNNNIYSVNINK